MGNKRTSLGTKFLVVLIVNFVLFIIESALRGYFTPRPPLYGIISGCLTSIFYGSLYSLFVAKIWEIFEKEKTVPSSNIREIALACICGTIADRMLNVAQGNFSASMTYIFTTIEICLIFYLEKVFIWLSKFTKQIFKFAEFIDKFFVFYIYAIIIECFLSWMPGLNWEFLPLKIFWYIVGPFMDLFRPFIPTIVGIDFSPILAIAALVFLRRRAMLYFIDFINDAKIDNEESEVKEEEKNNEPENS